MCDQNAEMERIMRKLARHNVRNWALTGGLAYEMHGLSLGLDRGVRHWNDLDFVTGEFGYIPGTLSEDFLFRHVHRFAPPGKTMLQLIDRENAQRVDVFRACGETMNRAVEVSPSVGTMRIVALEDLIARAARLLLDLAERIPVASKHARDYLDFAGLADSARMETAWQDHRKPAHPATFEEARGMLHALIPASASLLIVPAYSQNPNEVCPQCAATRAFPLADPKIVLSLLGYC
jgi:hypothetical protein